MRLFYLYLLIIIIFYVYIRYHGNQLWFKSDSHVTPKVALHDTKHENIQPDFKSIFTDTKNDLMDFDFKPVEKVHTQNDFEQEDEHDSAKMDDGHSNEIKTEILNEGIGRNKATKYEGSSSLINQINDLKHDEIQTKLTLMNSAETKHESLSLLHKENLPKKKLTTVTNKEVNASTSAKVTWLAKLKSAPLLNKIKGKVGQDKAFESERISTSLNDKYYPKADSFSKKRKENTTATDKLLQTLRKQWKLYTQLDTDWKSILKPCEHDMLWKTKRATHQQTNIVTSSFTTDVKPAREFSSIYIHTKAISGIDKTVGGDAWRVYIRGPSALVAKVIDYNNGSYEALFLVQEPGIYTVYVILDFSQCDGLRDPPSDWFIQGMENKHKCSSNLTATAIECMIVGRVAIE